LLVLSAKISVAALFVPHTFLDTPNEISLGQSHGETLLGMRSVHDPNDWLAEGRIALPVSAIYVASGW
jgi:hypothetical protein